MNNVPLPVGTKIAICAKYSDVLVGAGFLVSVEFHGRILASVEQDEVWVYGVAPSGVSGSGQTLLEAHADFRQQYTSVLYDIAGEAQTFGEFKASVDALVQGSANLDESWSDAVKNLSNELAQALGLPIVAAARHKPSVTVTEVVLPVTEPAPPMRARQPALVPALNPALNKLDETPSVVLKKVA